MTREEIIKELSEMRTDAWTDSRQMEALEMAVKALEQEPSGDLISRQAVEDALYEYSENNDVNYNLIITEYIDTIPSVNPQEPKGMTKDDFIFNLKRCGCLLYKDGNTYYEENELIKCFEDVGALEQEPCEDAISRQAVIERLKKEDKILYTTTGLNYLIRAIEELPSVTQKSETVTEFADRCRECGAKYRKLLKQKTGHWIKRPPYGFKCSKCLIVHSRTSIFCPSCGAKMIEPQ